MVEQAYKEFLIQECAVQTTFVAKLKERAKNNEDHGILMQQADAFELTRCDELYDLFPDGHFRKVDLV